MLFSFTTENNEQTRVNVGHGTGSYGRECVCRVEVSEGVRTPSIAWLTAHEARMLAAMLVAFTESA